MRRRALERVFRSRPSRSRELLRGTRGSPRFLAAAARCGGVSVGGGRGFCRGADSFCALTRASSTAISRSTAAVAATARSRRSFAARTAARRFRSSAAARAASTAASRLVGSGLKCCSFSNCVFARFLEPLDPPLERPQRQGHPFAVEPRQRPSWLCVFCAANCQPTQDAVCHRHCAAQAPTGWRGLHDRIGP